jgi:hypothetical protein
MILAIPEDAIGNLNEAEEADEDNANPNERVSSKCLCEENSFTTPVFLVSVRANDKNIEHDAEMYDGEKEGGDIRNEQDYRHATGDDDDDVKPDENHKSPPPVIPPIPVAVSKSHSRDVR